MLKSLLAAVASGRAGNTAELAAAMQATPAMVNAMLEELERRGLLQRAGHCGKTCGGCPSAAGDDRAHACAWMLTAAGRRSATG